MGETLDMQKRHQDAWTRWQRLIHEQQASGKSVAEFCRERDLCAPQLFAWRRKLREATNSFVAVEVIEAESNTALRMQQGEELPVNSGTIPLSRTPAVDGEIGAAIEIRLSSRRSVFVAPGFDEHHFRTVIVALENTPEARSTPWA
jgi:transposase-like protein